MSAVTDTRAAVGCGLLVLLALGADHVAAQDSQPAKPLRGWEEEQHWPGPNVTARFNGQDMIVKFRDRQELTFYLSDPVAIERRLRPELVFKCWCEDSDGQKQTERYGLLAPTPGDAAGRLLEVVERDNWLYLRFELTGARPEFNQVTLHMPTKTGTLIINSLHLVDGPTDPVRLPPGELLRPRGEFPESQLSDLKLPTDAMGWPARRAELAKLWSEVLGDPPAPRPELDAKEISREELEEYTRLRVSFVSEGTDTIEAWLLVPRQPAGPAGRPAVVCCHPTNPARSEEMIGRSGRGDMAHAVHLVREGYITLAFDCWIMKADTPEMRKLNQQVAALAERRPGWTGLGKMAFDVSRAVDFLCSRPEVDRSRIGVIGHSLGGKIALFAAALDDRITATVVSEAGIGLSFSNWDAPWYLGDRIRGRVGELDNHQVLALVAPRALLLVGGNSADGLKSQPYIDEAGRVWRLLGAADKLALYVHKDGHTFRLPAASESYRWLAAHLQKNK